MTRRTRPRGADAGRRPAARPLATLLVLGAMGAAAWLAGCVSRPATDPTPATPARPLPPAAGTLPAAPAPAALLPPPAGTARDWTDYRRRAAERLVAANPDRTYLGPPQQVLLAVPVLEVELQADGSIRQVQVLRRPGQAPETVQVAIDAVRRSAPFGDVRHLPRPWRFTETFLFNDDGRFKPRTLDN